MRTEKQFFKLLGLVSAVADSASDAGCTDDLTVIEKSALEKLEDYAKTERENHQPRSLYWATVKAQNSAAFLVNELQLIQHEAADAGVLGMVMTQFINSHFSQVQEFERKLKLIADSMAEDLQANKDAG